MNSVKLKQPGPPNQFFNNDTQQRPVSRAILANDNAEEDHKPIEDAAIEGSADDEIRGTGIAAANKAVEINNPTTDGKQNWLAFFDSITNNHGE